MFTSLLAQLTRRTFLASFMHLNKCSTRAVTQTPSLSTSAADSEHGRYLPATFLRGGTSKGIFLLNSALPRDQYEWDSIFLGIMGSPDFEYGRQLNGMGGGVSSLSKIVLVRPASDDRRALGCHVEYTFVQIGIRDRTIDYSGNCGNLSSMVGVFALDEKLCDVAEVSDENRTKATVRAFNTNTEKIIETTFPLSLDFGSGGRAGRANLSLPETSIAGVPGKASSISLKFLNPGGARTGKLLPAEYNAPTTELRVDGYPQPFKASLVDATNPTVFVLTEEVCGACGIEDTSPKKLVGTTSSKLLELLESLRQAGAAKMGLDPSAQAQPKIAMIQAPPVPREKSRSTSSSSSEVEEDEDADILITALSMGVPHKAVPMTVGLCLGVAANVKGTLAWDIAQAKKAMIGGGTSTVDRLVKIRHPGGVVTVGAEFEKDSEVARSAEVVRTGRRLMKGIVWY